MKPDNVRRYKPTVITVIKHFVHFTFEKLDSVFYLFIAKRFYI